MNFKRSIVIRGKEIFPKLSFDNKIPKKRKTTDPKLISNFFLGNVNKIIPLEYAPSHREIICDNDDNGKYKMIINYSIPYGYCLDIHKSLIPTIIAYFQIPSEKDIYQLNDDPKKIRQELRKLWEAEVKE